MEPLVNEVAYEVSESIGDPSSYSLLTVKALEDLGTERTITQLDFRNNVPPALPLSLTENLKRLSVTSLSSADNINSLLKSLSLEEVNITKSKILPKIDFSVPSLRGLKKLNLCDCSVSCLPRSVTSLISLQELSLANNNLCGDEDLDEKLGMLMQLKVLDLSECDLLDIPKSISSLPLEALILAGNGMCDDFNDISYPESLKKLDLAFTNVSDTPQSISKLSHLQELSLARNDLEKDKSVNDVLSSLKSLKKLNLGACNLAMLPESISGLVSLVELQLSANPQLGKCDLTSHLSSLVNLEKLSLSECCLQEIPASIQTMEKIESLSFDKNGIRELPTWICDLNNLAHINIAHNNPLTKLNANLKNSSIVDINCDGCTALVEPPYFVCQGGIKSINPYYEDLEQGQHPITLSTVAVIGRKMAGKSSLVKSLIDKSIVRTSRQKKQCVQVKKSTIKDEATKVFCFEKLKVSDDQGNEDSVKVIDFGGDDVYHYAYQLTFRKDCIPLIVVDMEEYERMSNQWGRREATRKLIYEWIAQLYLACPDLDDPILVLTHKDVFVKTRGDLVLYENLKEELKFTIGELFLEFSKMYSSAENIKAFAHSSAKLGIFREAEICEIRHDEEYNYVYGKLEKIISERVQKSKVFLPLTWWKIVTDVQDVRKPCCTYDELLDSLQRESSDVTTRFDVILDFMQRAGLILRYPDVTDLRNVIFHNVSEVTKVIALLFDHSVSEHCGIIKTDTLNRLLSGRETDSQIPSDITTALLRTFKLIHGPISYNNMGCFMIPQFMPNHVFPTNHGEVSMKVSLNFVGLAPPKYAYHQLTVNFLSCIVAYGQKANVEAQQFPYGNGISAQLPFGSDSDKWLEIHLIHEIDDQKVTLQLEGCVTQIHKLWTLLKMLLQQFSKEITTLWKATQVRYEVPCPHCYISAQLNPERLDDPDFIMEMVKSSRAPRAPRAPRSKQYCDKADRIPKLLHEPYVSDNAPTAAELDELKKYIIGIRPAHKNDLDVVIRLLRDNEAEPKLKFDIEHQRSLRPTAPVENLYLMTKTRGRALIINNQHTKKKEGARYGSEYDYDNIHEMLTSFGFVVSNNSADKNWSARDIVTAIHIETQLVDKRTGSSVHDGLGMFVLVLMTHGDLGRVSGCDDINLRLTDIYKLLSSQNFPAMRGKPKLIILQACSGDEHEELTSPEPKRRRSMPQTYPKTAVASTSGQIQHCAAEFTQASTSSAAPDAEVLDRGHLCVDDLLIMKASFDGFAASRSPNNGSVFIRSLIAVFSKCAAHCDLRTLSDKVQEVVRQLSKKQTEQRQRDPNIHEKIQVGQVPVTTCTFTNERKLYLSPGVNMRTEDHPESVTDPKPPNEMKTKLIWAVERGGELRFSIEAMRRV